MTSSGPEGAAAPRRMSSYLRVAGFVFAVALGGVAVWLIVTSTSQKHIEIGILAGLWGLLLGAYSAFGSRPHTSAAGDPGTALELRSAAALARADDVASQQAFQARLEAILRREVQLGVARELVGLREEVSSLRSEILEKVGGQLRMERTETTRLFGSGLEELQREVRQLKVRQFSEPDVIVTRPAPAAETIDAEEVVEVDASPAPGRTSLQKPPAREASSGTRPLRPASAFEPVGNRAPAQPDSVIPPPSPLHTWPPMRTDSPAPASAAPAPQQPAPQPPAPQPPAQPVAQPPVTQPVAQPVTQPPPVAQPAAPPAAAASAPTPKAEPAPLPRFELPPVPRIEVPTVPRFDPASFVSPAAPVTPIPGTENADMFASMPRIPPFTDFELEPVNPSGQGTDSEPADESADAKPAGRHSTPAGETGESRSGGRRHRSEDGGNDMLARILERERR